VTKEYEQLVAVDDLSLDIREGEFMCFLGPSGSGKTTTLNMVAGLEEPTSGEVIMDGEVVNSVPPQGRDIGLIFQSLALFSKKTVRGNIGFSPRVNGASEAEIERTVEEIASITGIDEAMLDQTAGSLTPDDQQRVALARSLADEPRLLLLDEPMDNLDHEEALDMRAEIKQMKERLGQTMVYVTHDQEEAMSLADRIFVIHEGELQQLATPTELYDEPVNKFVAGFIGSPSMNFLTGTLGESGMTLLGNELSYDALEMAFADFDRERYADTDEMTVGVRPEAFVYGSTDADLAFTVTIDEVEPLGSKTVLHILHEGAEFTVLTKQGISVTPGTKATVGVGIDDLYPIDPETEEVLY
jgi:multiple sugar transport system ATP-binding protein